MADTTIQAPSIADRPELSRLCIDTIRVLAMDAVEEAKSGHPGTPMALAPAAYLLFTRHLRHNPGNPEWPDRDRFILSAGHASMLLYSALHLSGYDLSLEELVRFRQWGSKTAGHPELGEAPGIETTTGPLGQGVANSVGLALAERWLADRFNRPNHRIVDHRTYAICSDGDLMEGISHEAAELAGHQRLGKLVWIFDDNRITIDGTTDLSTSIDHQGRFEAYGWHVEKVADGNDLEALDGAIARANEVTDRPSLIVLRTTIAHGSPNLAGHHSTHGAPLGAEEIRATKKNLGYPSLEPFHVDARALAQWRRARERGKELEGEWRDELGAYRAAFPREAEELEAFLAGDLPTDWDRGIPSFEGASGGDATRSSSGKVIQALAETVPNLVGGSADLAGSNKTEIGGSPALQADTPGGRNIHFGVREHAMGGIMNGMALHGGLRPFGGTFLVFSDYMRPSIRLAALMKLPVTYVFSHDSIGLGEDGPTHQPVEHLLALRAIPDLLDLRPGDARETAEAWRVAVARQEGPVFLALTRQKVPHLERDEDADAGGVANGGYIFREASNGAPQAILLASGSELHLAVEARDVLEADGIPTRVVSLPSWHLFGQQSEAYRNRVLPPSVRNRVSIEASTTLGWERWIGTEGRSVGLDRFGASAPYEVLYERFGITASAAVDKVREQLGPR